MAQRTTNVGGTSTIAANTYNGDQTAINNLRNSIQAGNVCTAADINTITSMINSWRGHRHGFVDWYQIADYGNNGDRGNYMEDRQSATASDYIGGSNVSTVSAGNTITASHHNSMKDETNRLRSHAHGITDRTSM